MTDSQDATRTEGEGETLDMPEGVGAFAKGQILGERYQILEMLGRGGMGEVWKAFDLKLRVEVALKALRPEFFKSERRLELLRQEVRAAREVVSPNVCRIFDLIEVEGRELVSMEYVDGATLLGVLQERGPLELKEAQDIASQFLAGLEAIHAVGLIHRDIKPENIMLTRAGRVVVMDFGLARQEEEGGGSVSGTPAYMSPEQAAGQTLDARADVYSAGVVLAEMVSPEGIRSYESRQSVWEGVRSEPAKLPDSPWAPVIQRAVKKDREGRFNTARTLTRALEDVTLRVEGAEDLHPYPGLASFTEDDAEYFFGREAEVEQMWRKLEGPPRMLALVGPSGAGKTSFISAGLVPSAAASWSTAVCKPGTNPELALSRALAGALAGDAEAIDLLLQFDDPEVAMEVVSRWRQRSVHALLVVDQFEELFTQNSQDDQRRFADLLNRFVLEGDVHVLFSMRDDFLFRCHEVESLTPIFFELTPIGPPVGGALRRALVRPATKCGYRFEDDELVDEMLAEVEGERGALPLLAFALARLWEKRDRETGLLTREAYEEIGGVGGALAQHAEATIDRIGTERIPIVRELFRNLVTAEGTRAVREWDELLSVFDTNDVGREGINPSPTKRGAAAKQDVGAGFTPAREAAEEVLRKLIDARLLTSYEVREDDDEPTRRVEIIHESLLANWPRLVRWQTQDKEGAQLRDELRQAARAWDEHDRSDDRLWTGTAYREYAVWRERYPGGLTETEEAFASAMTSLATRRRRRRRVAAAAVLLAFAVVATVTTALWRRSVLQERRAEATNLISLGQLELEPYPSASVAHAISSLELADTFGARMLAMKALWKGPTAFVVDDAAGHVFQTPDGQWLVATSTKPARIRLIGKDGRSRWLELQQDLRCNHDLNPTGEVLCTVVFADEMRHIILRSIPDGRQLAEARFERKDFFIFASWREGRAQFYVREGDTASIDAVNSDGTVERLGSFTVEPGARGSGLSIAPPFDVETGRWVALHSVSDGAVSVIEIGEHGLSEPRLLGFHEGTEHLTGFHPRGELLATSNAEGTIKLWSLATAEPPRVLQGPAGILGLQGIPGLQFVDGPRLVHYSYSVDERRSLLNVWSLAIEKPGLLRSIELDFGRQAGAVLFESAGYRCASGFGGKAIRLYSLRTPEGAEPVTLTRGASSCFPLGFSTDGDFLLTKDTEGLALWPLTRALPAVIRQHEEAVLSVVFDPRGQWLASGSADRFVKLWPLAGEVPDEGRTVFVELNSGGAKELQVSPDGARLGVSLGNRSPQIVSLDGQTEKPYEDLFSRASAPAFSADGRYVAVAGLRRGNVRDALFVWKVGSGNEPVILEPERNLDYLNVRFLRNGKVLHGGKSGLWSSDPETGESELLHRAVCWHFDVSEDERWIALVELSEFSVSGTGPAVLLDLETGTATPLDSHGDQLWSIAIDATGSMVVTGDNDGVIRVGPASGEEPHLLLGHEGRVWSVAIDPLGRWIASGGEDTTVRLWPMPDLSKPPLHTLPREELIAKLKTLTNLRVVRDPESATGWKLTHDPFPGWETVPTW